MDSTQQEILQFVTENDVKFIRLAFCDLFGRLKNISIMAEELPRAFADGISFDASAVRGFLQVEESDLFLFPDPSTLSILPWRPQQGRVVRMFCDIRHPDGHPFPGDGRAILRQAMQRCQALGFRCQIGPECEFYLFETDSQGYPTQHPHDNAGYLDVAPMDKGENVRREICLTLEQMGIRPESSHHEQGPGQHEVDFRYSDVLLAADQLITFKSVVRNVAARNGLHASFLPKPLQNQSGNGLHINLSLSQGADNLFAPVDGALSPVASSFIAGVLAKMPEMTLFFNPLLNSYRRFGAFEAPRYITWSPQNRSPLIRIPAAQPHHARMELRSADPACNPYWAFALLIHAGLYGVEHALTLPAPSNLNLYQASSAQIDALPTLPGTLEQALIQAEQSTWLPTCLPAVALEHFLSYKREELQRFSSHEQPEAYEYERYFPFI